MAGKRSDTTEGFLPDFIASDAEARPQNLEDTISLPLGALLDQTQERAAFVQVISGRSTARIFPLSSREDTTIGRSEDCGIALDDGDISRRHASLSPRPDGTAVLTDLGSRNGIYVKGKRIKQAVLYDGDRFQLGAAVVLKFMIQDRLEQECLQQLYENATRDPLTGVFNKKYVTERLEQEFSYCSRNRIPLAAILLDIDHFKQINDTYGHTPAGDSVLGRLASLIAASVRTEDVLGRFGGEEFLLVCRGSDRFEVARLAERLRRTVQNTAFTAKTLNGVGVEIPVRISLGTAVSYGGNYADAQALLSAADRALYEAKRGGRNRVAADAAPQRPTAPMISSPTRPKLGGILVRMGRLTKEQLKIALDRQKTDPGAGALGTVLIALGFCNETDVAAALAAQYGVDTAQFSGRSDEDAPPAEGLQPAAARRRTDAPRRRDQEETVD